MQSPDVTQSPKVIQSPDEVSIQYGKSSKILKVWRKSQMKIHSSL
jgi:hypothetical protein